MDPDKRRKIYIFLGIFLFFCVAGLIIALLLKKKSCPNDNFKDNGKCDTCKNDNFTDNNCNTCKNNNFKDGTCTECKPNYIGEFCCHNDNFKDATCSTCKNDNFTDNNCDTCKNNNFKDGTSCTECKPDYIGEFCCDNDNFKDATCSTCKNDNFTDNKCDTCINHNFIDTTCSTCKPGFKGSKCNLKEHKCGGDNPCFPTGKLVDNYQPSVADINSVALYTEVAAHLEKNNHKYWFQSMTNEDIKNYPGRVYDDSTLEKDPGDGSPWASYELVN